MFLLCNSYVGISLIGKVMYNYTNGTDICAMCGDINEL